jgi:hypothetical protein
MAQTQYEVESYELGKPAENKIVFKSVDDMEKAYKDLDNGNDICIEKDGIVIKLLHKSINAKVYDGTLMFCARKKVV